MKYTGRIVITLVMLALATTARLYGLYHHIPMLKIPFIGIFAVLICWWFGSQYDKVKFHSIKDTLTGIHNRRFVYQRFPKLLAKMRKRNEHLTLFLIDVDNFKQINDTHGHEMGDRVLQHISRILVSSTSRKETVARWAGDEFVVISPNSNETSDEAILKQIKNALRELSGELHMNVSVSIGASVYPNDAKILDALLAAADRELYELKSR